MRETIEKLQALYRRGNSTTPRELLSQAVDVMRVRPLLLERHRSQAERALANVDLYLSMSTGYAVRGLRAFAEAMTAAWMDETRAVEGRPDAQEEAVALFTMHAAKGLEWPIVIPLNTMTGVISPDSVVIDRQTDTFYCPVLGVAPDRYDVARQAEKDELDRERIRLWYVAATRARDLLVLPWLEGGRSEAFGEYGHRPWQKGFKDEKRFAEESASLERFKAEWAATHGPAYRGTSYEMSHRRGGPYVASDEFHQHDLARARLYKHRK